MSDIGDVARAIETVGKVALELLTDTQQEQIKEVFEASKKRVNEYKEALLDDDVDLCRRLELGLLYGVEADLGSGEIGKLESEPATGFNKFNQLGWFQRAEGGRLAAQIVNIVRATTPSDH